MTSWQRQSQIYLLKDVEAATRRKKFPTKSSQAKNINLPSTTYQLNEIIKTATSPFSSSSKRKYSPWKSPLSRTKTLKSIKYSPLTKKPKPRPARALFESDVSENIIETDNSASPVLCPHEFIAENPTNSNEDDLQEIISLIPIVLDKLSVDGFDQVILTFFRQLASDSFPLKNIAFLLWADVVKWVNCTTTTHMRYSDDTKKFWKMGWRIFGGRFVDFMSGFKNDSQVVSGQSEKSRYKPDTSDISFAVPSFPVLRIFDPHGDCGERYPGMLNCIISQHV